MSDPERRRFTLADAMGIVAAVGMMLSTGRLARWLLAKGDTSAYFVPDYLWCLSLTFALICPSLVLLPVLLSRPRDRRRLRAGSPGLAVHIVVLTLLLVSVAGWVAHRATSWLLQPPPLGEWHFYPSATMNFFLHEFRYTAAAAIAAVWIAMAIVGRWRPERAWDDRLGRLIGLLWLLFFLLEPLVSLLL